MGTFAEEPAGRKNEWKRLIYILLFAVIFNVAEWVLFLVVLVQFLSRVVTGASISRLDKLGRVLGDYMRELVHYLSYHSDRKPYPFAAWPKGSPDKAET
jgi:hypothetical protein